MSEYLKIFETQEDYINYINSDDFNPPNTSYCLDNNRIYYNMRSSYELDDTIILEKSNRDCVITPIIKTFYYNNTEGVPKAYETNTLLFDFTKIGGLKYIGFVDKSDYPLQDKTDRVITEKELYFFYNMLNKYKIVYNTGTNDIQLFVEDKTFIIKVYNGIIEENNSEESYKKDEYFEYYKNEYKNLGRILTDEGKLVLFDLIYKWKVPNNYEDYTEAEYQFLEEYEITNIRTVDKEVVENYFLEYLYVRD